MGQRRSIKILIVHDLNSLGIAYKGSEEILVNVH